LQSNIPFRALHDGPYGNTTLSDVLALDWIMVDMAIHQAVRQSKVLPDMYAKYDPYPV
jgi:hypothetical protein